jgi:hypothetical protein
MIGCGMRKGSVKQRVVCQARAIKTNGFVVCCRNRRVLRKITAEWKGKDRRRSGRDQSMHQP